MLVNNFITPLALTVMVECAAAGVLGYRDKLFFLSAAVVNLITNPFLNFIGVLLYTYGIEAYFFHIIVPLEIAVVFVEWLILAYLFPKKKKRLLLLSAVMNSASFLMGLLVF